MNMWKLLTRILPKKRKPKPCSCRWYWNDTMEEVD